MTSTNSTSSELEAIFADGRRQLAICNACRYCAGYCPVWPAMERRGQFSVGDLEQLANLCHDCRDCYTACMYTPPHEFKLNPPKLFTQIREDTYDRYIWPHRIPAALRGFTGLSLVFLVSVAVLVALGLLTGAPDWLTTSSGDIYHVFGHLSLIAVMSFALIYSLAVTITGLRRFWKAIRTEDSTFSNGGAWGKTMADILALRNMTGGAEGCSYIENQPTLARKVGHQFLMFGFLGTFLATCSAAIQQYCLGMLPPYPPLSVPFILGCLGGTAAVIGAATLLIIKPKADASLSTREMSKADHGLLGGLLVLMLTGFLVTMLRYTPAFPATLILHLSTVLTAFLVFPRTKFVHLFFRAIAIYQDNVEVQAHLSRLQTSGK